MWFSYQSDHLIRRGASKFESDLPLPPWLKKRATTALLPIVTAATSNSGCKTPRDVSAILVEREWYRLTSELSHRGHVPGRSLDKECIGKVDGRRTGPCPCGPISSAGSRQHHLTHEFTVIGAVAAAGEREADARVADAGDQHVAIAKPNGDSLADVQQRTGRLGKECAPGVFDQNSPTGAIHGRSNRLIVRSRVGRGGNS